MSKEGKAKIWAMPPGKNKRATRLTAGRGGGKKRKKRIRNEEIPAAVNVQEIPTLKTDSGVESKRNR